MRDEHNVAGAERKPTGAPAQVRARLANFRGARRVGMIGLAEIAALAVALLLLLAAVGAYFFMLVPQRSRLAALETERELLQAKLRASTEGVERNQSTQTSVEKIVRSLSEFETTALPTRDSQTTTAVIEELNDKTRRNGLARAQFSFSHLDETVPGQTRQQQGSNASRTGGSNRQSIFPVIDISLTIEGPYANLRRFIREIEQSRRFIVINAIQLEGVTDTGNVERAALVSLRLDMSAYFRRNGAGGSLGATSSPAATSQ